VAPSGSTLASPTADDEGLISVSVAVTLFDGKVSGELPLGHVVDIDRISVNGSAHDFRQSDSVSITLDPGDSYYLNAALTAQVAIGGQGIADAGETLPSRSQRVTLRSWMYCWRCPNLQPMR